MCCHTITWRSSGQAGKIFPDFSNLSSMAELMGESDPKQRIATLAAAEEFAHEPD
jgi:hypothetical protein